jgi:hypothetical protein
LYLKFRKLLFYPLNYGTVSVHFRKMYPTVFNAGTSALPERNGGEIKTIILISTATAIAQMKVLNGTGLL